MTDEPRDTNPETPPEQGQNPASAEVVPAAEIPAASTAEPPAAPVEAVPAADTSAGPGAETPAAEVPAAPTKRVSHRVTPPPPVQLAAYEGPLDLLLDLIRKQEINIYDIPIAKITEQYLAYLRVMEELNIDVAGEFIFMAATLIHIKSRLLLPPDPTAPPEEQGDPREELVQRLLEHEQFKTAAEMLSSKRLLEDAMWSQSGLGEFREAEDEPGLAVSLFDLISVFHDILERAKKRPQFRIKREEVSVVQMVERVKLMLRDRSGPVALEELVGDFVWRQALIAMFLALLEMARLRAVLVRQLDTFSPITVAKSRRFEEVLAATTTQELVAGLDESLG